VLSYTRVNKAATCTRTNLIEMVKIRILTFKCHFFCVSNYTPLLPLPFIPYISLRGIKLVPDLSSSRLNLHLLRGPAPQKVISNNRHKQTPLRDPAPQNPTTPEVIRVPNPHYGSSASTQPQYMEFILTPGFPKQ